MPGQQSLRHLAGIFFFALALLFTGWLLLGMLGVVPLLMQLPGESTVRTHASAAVLFFMFAAWGFLGKLGPVQPVSLHSLDERNYT